MNGQGAEWCSGLKACNEGVCVKCGQGEKDGCISAGKVAG
jgi:hypothetical protein